MVFKTPVKKSPIKIKSSPKPKLKSIKTHHRRHRRSLSPLKTLVSAASSPFSASLKSCRRHLVTSLFSCFPRRNGFHRFRSAPISPVPVKKVESELSELILPPTWKKTLFLDLDETLVHSKTDPPPEKYDFMVYPVIEGRKIPFYVLKRPGLDQFLRAAADACFEIVIFTAGLKEYASLVINQLDPTGDLITHRLYRGSCREIEPGRFVKDLSQTRRTLDQIVIIDDNPNAYMLQPDNALPVKPFVDDLKDEELKRIGKFFGVCELYDDVRDALRWFRDDVNVV